MQYQLAGFLLPDQESSADLDGIAAGLVDRSLKIRSQEIRADRPFRQPPRGDADHQHGGGEEAAEQFNTQPCRFVGARKPAPRALAGRAGTRRTVRSRIQRLTLRRAFSSLILKRAA